MQKVEGAAQLRVIKHQHQQMNNVGAVRPMVLAWSVIAVLFGAALCLSGQQAAALAQQRVNASGASTSPTDAEITAAVPGTAVTLATSTAPRATPGTKITARADTNSQLLETCAPADDTVPSPLDLTATPDGVTQQIDPPDTYQIFGTNAKALRSQITNCGPQTGDAEVFTAETMYRLTWRYRFETAGNGMCRVNYVAVGIHISQTMPLWQSSAETDDAALASHWSAFMKALKAHEDGHTALDVQHAQSLYDDIKHYPPTRCDQIEQSIRHLTDSDVARLNQANDGYDSKTNHGATQGAILPN